MQTTISIRDAAFFNSPQTLLSSIALEKKYLSKVINTASRRYRTYKIKKKSGGLRTIDHPSKKVKFLQRWLTENVLAYLPVHQTVYSYKEGQSIKNHALAHKPSKYLLRVDFKNFFPSILDIDVRKLLEKNKSRFPIKISQTDIHLISSVVCKHGKLTIGAPSSPCISNAILYDFDYKWFLYCRRRRVVYTRYADDVYFSTNSPNKLADILKELKKDLAERKSPSLQINNEKTVYSSKKWKRVITGLVLTSQNRISVGRKQKRYIRSLVYRFKMHQIDGEKLNYLKGYLSYVQSVEPTFIKSLSNKFGPDVIETLRH